MLLLLFLEHRKTARKLRKKVEGFSTPKKVKKKKQTFIKPKMFQNNIVSKIWGNFFKRLLKKTSNFEKFVIFWSKKKKKKHETFNGVLIFFLVVVRKVEQIFLLKK